MATCCLFNAINLFPNEGTWLHSFIHSSVSFHVVFFLYFIRFTDSTHTEIHSIAHYILFRLLQCLFVCSVVILCVERSFCRFNKLINMFIICGVIFIQRYFTSGWIQCDIEHIVNGKLHREISIGSENESKPRKNHQHCSWM